MGRSTMVGARVDVSAQALIDAAAKVEGVSRGAIVRAGAVKEAKRVLRQAAAGGESEAPDDV